MCTYMYVCTSQITCKMYMRIIIQAYFTYYPTALDGFGWTRNNNDLEIVWETETSKEKVKDRLDYILNGCKCKTGCRSKRCKCKKAGRVCGPGCQCINCSNTDHCRRGGMKKSMS